jgi:hypothetical protein
MIPTSPQPFIVRKEYEKTAWQHGFRRALGETDGWAAFGSTTAQGTIWLAAESAPGPWFLALDHPGLLTCRKAAPGSSAAASVAKPRTDAC